MRELSEAATGSTAIEVMRSARHEAIGAIANCHAILNRVWKELGPSAEPRLDAIAKELDRVRASLEATRAVESSLADPWRQVKVGELWDSAVSVLAGRIEAEHIAIRRTGPNLAVLAKPDRLRQMFLNLLLNSLEAFASGRRRGRRIELAISQPGGAMRLTYSDNATGINPQRLHVPEEHALLPLHQLVFQAGVSSKRNGTGYGLWLARRFLDEHRGSIDLVDHRRGVTFVIRLPRPDEIADLKES